ncbi:MAG TPA: hypothetical protein VIY48_12285 [Candidatus Paceibacterota bacterium]
MANIGINMGKGFYMTFANGWTVSVQFGPSNYCNNRTFEYASLADMRKAGEQGCDNAEVAAMKDGIWYRGKGWTDSVKGWLTPDEIAAFIAEVAALPAYLEPAELAGDYSDELTE